MQKPLVSVICITYNHADYIRNTLDGFLMQDVPFLYEIVIHDDASTDGTDEIIREYASRYPNLIVPILEQENQYSRKMDFMSCVYAKCTGKYYAVCEGDDFWIDPLKLSIQVNYMENHPKCMMTVHNALVFHYKTEKFYTYSDVSKSHVLSPKEIVKSGFASASMMFRREALFPRNSFYTEGGIGDWPLRLHVLEQEGEIYYFDRIMSVYRAWTQNSYCQRTYGAFEPALKHVWELIRLMEKYNFATNRKYEKYLIARIQCSVLNLFEIAGVKRILEFEKLLDCCNECFEVDGYIKKLKHVFVQMYEENAPLESSIRNKMRDFSYVVIYGAGKLAQKVARQIEEAGSSYAGFVVSKGKEHPDEFMGKHVWTMDDVPFPRHEIFAVVAINPGIWDELVECLENNGISHISCPFLYDIQI